VPNWFSFCALNTESSVDWMVALDMLGSKMCTFGPKLGVFDCAGQPPVVLLTTQLNEADPEAPVPSLAVTVAVDVAAVVGVPVIRPEELMDRPAGRPVALKVSVWPDAESVALTCRLTAVPTVELWLPGLVTVTVLPPPPPVVVKTPISHME